MLVQWSLERGKGALDCGSHSPIEQINLVMGRWAFIEWLLLMILRGASVGSGHNLKMTQPIYSASGESHHRLLISITRYSSQPRICNAVLNMPHTGGDSGAVEVAVAV